MSLNTILATAPLTTTNYVIKATGTALGNSIIYDNGTNVGIGTTSVNASTILAVAGSNTATDARGILSVNTNNAYAADLGGSISLGGENGSGSTPYPFGKISGRKEGGGAAYSGYLSLATTFSDGTITERMRITSAGNVGIGTSSPTYTLDVSGTGRYTSTLLVSGALTGAAATFSGTLTANGTIQQNSSQDLGTSAYFSANVTNGFRVLNAANTVSLLSITNAGAATFSSSVTAAGNITTSLSQAATTDISVTNTSVSNGAAAQISAIDGGASQIDIVAFGSGSTGTLYGITKAKLKVIRDNSLTAQSNGLAIGTDAAVPFYVFTNSAERMRITSGGNVGIGTTNPTGKLDVASRGITVGSMPVGSVIQVVSFTYSTGFSTGSNSDTDTGLTLSITPTSSTSKILVIITAYVRATVGSGNCFIYSKVFRGASALTTGYAAMGNFNSSDIRGVDAINYLDSPATTSSTTYKYTLNSQFASTVYMNSITTPSTITLMEIAQ